MNNKSSRSNLAFRNSIVSGLVTLLNFPIQFINRYFMVHYLGATYLGLTSLFTNILSVLSLADLGIGTAIVFLRRGKLRGLLEEVGLSRTISGG